MHGCSSCNGGKVLIKLSAQEAMWTHSMIHRESLAGKELCSEVSEVMDTVTRTVNYIKIRPLKSRLLQINARKWDAVSVTPVLL
jgi:hypothetical protein